MTIADVSIPDSTSMLYHFIKSLNTPSFDDSMSVLILMNNGKIDVNWVNKEDKGRTLLHCAAECKGVNILKIILDSKDVNLYIEDDDGRTALEVACVANTLHSFFVLVDKMNTVDIRGRTPLWYACYHGNFELAKFILVTNKGVGDYITQKGKDVTTQKKYTALEIAAKMGHKNICELISDHFKNTQETLSSIAGTLFKKVELNSRAQDAIMMCHYYSLAAKEISNSAKNKSPPEEAARSSLMYSTLGDEMRAKNDERNAKRWDGISRVLKAVSTTSTSTQTSSTGSSSTPSVSSQSPQPPLPASPSPPSPLPKIKHVVQDTFVRPHDHDYNTSSPPSPLPKTKSVACDPYTSSRKNDEDRSTSPLPPAKKHKAEE